MVMMYGFVVGVDFEIGAIVWCIFGEVFWFFCDCIGGLEEEVCVFVVYGMFINVFVVS